MSYKRCRMICCCCCSLYFELLVLATQVKKLTFGDLESSFMGPLISLDHRTKVESYVALAQSEGFFPPPLVSLA